MYDSTSALSSRLFHEVCLYVPESEPRPRQRPHHGRDVCHVPAQHEGGANRSGEEATLAAHQVRVEALQRFSVMQHCKQLNSEQE